MTVKEAIAQLKRTKEGWLDFWGSAKYVVHDDDIKAIDVLINEVQKKK